MDKPVPLDNLRSFITDTLHKWQVPGAAVAIIQDGRVLLCEGFGLRAVHSNLPVTAETLFPIASCTKAFTAMSLALLADEGRLDWDVPVREYLPAFHLKDPLATERMTARDLLTHRSGLPRHDVMWYAANFSRQQIFERLRYLEPSRDFRSYYQYQNIMYMVAGMLAGHLAGLSWESFVQQRIFAPLGMSRSNFSTAITQQDQDHATPYIQRQEQVRQAPFFEADGENDPIGPAGSIISSATDMAAWLRLHINAGLLDGARFVSAANLELMHTPQMVQNDTSLRPIGLDLASYGLGWSIYNYKGHKLVAHSGGIDGFSSRTSFIAGSGLGVVVLTNLENNPASSILSYTLYDRFLGLQPTDWNTRFIGIKSEEKAAGVRAKAITEAARIPDTSPSHPQDDYLGDYTHPAYGRISVSHDGREFQLGLNGKLALDLRHYHFDIFQAHLEQFDLDYLVSFNTGLRGEIASLSVQLEPEVAPIVFSPQAEAGLTSPDYLSQFAGAYTLFDYPLSIALKGGQLHLAYFGRPETALIPFRDGEFRAQDPPGLEVQFERDEMGQIKAAIILQAGQAFSAAKLKQS